MSNDETVKFGWFGMEPDDSTDAVPDKYVGTLGTVDSDGMIDEIAVIVHRASPLFPVDGPMYKKKDANGAALSELLNLALAWADADPRSQYLEACEDLAKIAALARSIRDA